MNGNRIPLNIPPVVGTEEAYLADAIASRKLCGGNRYARLCEQFLEDTYSCQKVLLTPSCTHGLEMAAMLCQIQPGDEVIMPSYTFASTANAFVLRGAKIVFVDIRPDTQNLDETKIEAAITPRTRAIVPVHYAGVACEMDAILQLADHYGLRVVEDAAQGVHGFYKGRALGTMGDFGTYSFHETKNYTMGEGGALLIRSQTENIPAEIIREKGTNRAEFLQGMVDKYTWVGQGSSYLPSELGAAFLYGQLLAVETINQRRLARYDQYARLLRELEDREKIQLPVVPRHCRHNAHIFYIKTRSLSERRELMAYLDSKGITCAFHYVPLHTSPFGAKYAVFHGEDAYTTDTAERLVRLPLYMDLTAGDVDRVCQALYGFYRGR